MRCFKVGTVIVLLVCGVLGGKLLNVPSKKYPTIMKAMYVARSADTVILSNGEYREKVTVPSGVTLLSENLHSAIINGGGRGDAITLTNKSSVVGVSVTNATNGIVSKSLGNTIKNCKLFALDGSAILCVNNIPLISNNVIVQNGRFAVQMVNVTSGSTILEHNTIASNRAGGIAIDGRMNIVIKNNIFYANGGDPLKYDDKNLNVTIKSNLFSKNMGYKFKIPDGNFTFLPKFISPLGKKDYRLKGASKAKNSGNDGKDLGAIF